MRMTQSPTVVSRPEGIITRVRGEVSHNSSRKSLKIDTTVDNNSSVQSSISGYIGVIQTHQEKWINEICRRLDQEFYDGPVQRIEESLSTISVEVVRVSKRSDAIEGK